MNISADFFMGRDYLLRRLYRMFFDKIGRAPTGRAFTASPRSVDV